MLPLILTALVLLLMVLIVYMPTPHSRERIVAHVRPCPYADRCRVALISTVAPLDTPS